MPCCILDALTSRRPSRTRASLARAAQAILAHTLTRPRYPSLQRFFLGHALPTCAVTHHKPLKIHASASATNRGAGKCSEVWVLSGIHESSRRQKAPK